MNSKHAQTLPAHMTSLDPLGQEQEQLQPASTISPDSSHAIVYSNSCTLAFCSDYDSFGWDLGDKETSVCPANLHAEAFQSLAIDSPFLPDLVNSAHEDLGFGGSSEVKIPHTIEQSFNIEFEEDDECSWLEITKYIDASVFDGHGPQDSSWIASQNSSRNSTESEDLYKLATENSTPCTLPPFSETEKHDTPHSISLESQTPEVDNSQTILTKATKDIEVIDLTGDDLHASPEEFSPRQAADNFLASPELSYSEPTDHSSTCTAVTQPLIFVDLTHDDNDDDKVKERDDDAETWHDGNCDNIDYSYRSSYENKTRSMTPVVGSSRSRNPSNFAVTEILHNGKTYRWNHRCKQYKNGDSHAKPNHKDTAIVIRDGGSDVPINLTYKGSGIWEGFNYRIGAVISDKVAKDMVFRRHSRLLKRKRGCMYSDDLSPRNCERKSEPDSS